MQQFSIEQMQSQIRELQRAIDTPGTPPDEIQMHRELIQYIQKQIAIRQAAQHGPVTPPPPPAPPQQIKHNNPPEVDPARLLKRINTANQQQTTNNQQPATVRAPGKQDTLTAAQLNDLQQTQLHADLNATPPIVAIQWPAWDWGIKTYTEADARGRYTTALRDLAESKLAEQGRYDHMTRYTTWWRAIHYYRALTTFWGAPPTRQQLQIRNRTERYIHIFQLITQAALQPQP